MSDQHINSEARERVLVTAESLFAEHGYRAVTLRDVAQVLGIKHASLYYHVPHGKEDLYVEVMTRRMQRYQAELETVIERADGEWPEQLRAAANWSLSQPAMHLGRMLQSDMRSISGEAAEKLRLVVRDSLISPISKVFQVALVENPTRQKHSSTYAGMFFSLIEGVYNLPPSYVTGAKSELVDIILDLLVNGLRSSSYDEGKSGV